MKRRTFFGILTALILPKKKVTVLSSRWLLNGNGYGVMLNKWPPNMGQTIRSINRSVS